MQVLCQTSNWIGARFFQRTGQGDVNRALNVRGLSDRSNVVVKATLRDLRRLPHSGFSTDSSSELHKIPILPRPTKSSEHYFSVD